MDKSSQQTASDSGKSCDSPLTSNEEVPGDEIQLRWNLDQIRHKLLIMSGKGGVGKSSVAVSLALTLARRGFSVGLVDVDLHGPDILRMLGLGKPLGLTSGQYLLPADLYHNLKIISIESMMKDRDAAIIWRGGLKHKVIRQFFTQIDWGSLDFLIIDAPPGTGDEILTVARAIPEIQALIVTTPQEISLADVRKSVDFCHQVDIRVLGLVENMGHVICPHCGKSVPLFQSSPGGRSVQSLGFNLIASLPFDPQVVEAADAGRLIEFDTSKSPFFQTLNQVVDSVLSSVGQPEPQKNLPSRDSSAIKIAIPVQDGKLSPQLGQNRRFCLITVQDNRIIDHIEASPPDFKPGILPAWLERQGVTHIIAANVGDQVRRFFQRKGIEIIAGASETTPEALVQQYLDNQLKAPTI